MRHFFLLLFLSFCINSFSQYSMDLIPPKSPRINLTKTIGFTDVSINYGSPSVKGRVIFGELEEWDKVWRAGADKATTVEFSTDVSILDQEVPAGKYGLFIIPKKDGLWEIILSKKWKQWGAFRYSEDDDLARFTVPAQQSAISENLQYDIYSNSSKQGLIYFSWEDYSLELPFDIEIKSVLDARIIKKTAEMDSSISFVLYLQAAEYVIKNLNDPNYAFSLITRSEELFSQASNWNKQFYPLDYLKGHIFWTKALCLAKLNKKDEALYYAEEMKKIKTGYNFYEKKNQREKIDETILSWK